MNSIDILKILRNPWIRKHEFFEVNFEKLRDGNSGDEFDSKSLGQLFEADPNVIIVDRSFCSLLKSLEGNNPLPFARDTEKGKVLPIYQMCKLFFRPSQNEAVPGEYYYLIMADYDTLPSSVAFAYYCIRLGLIDVSVTSYFIIKDPEDSERYAKLMIVPQEDGRFVVFLTSLSRGSDYLF